MIWRWLVLTLLLAQPAPSRNLEPMPEPAVRPAIVERLYLPLVMAGEVTGAAERPVYGYASPHRRAYTDVPFYNWYALPEFCSGASYWPMVRGQVVDIEMTSACDDGERMLLIYNEPELGHYHAEPREAVAFVYDWRQQWSGPIACCGNFYGDGGGELTGLQWMLTFVTEYHIAHGMVPPLTAIHLHVYEIRTLDLDLLADWRDLADAYGYKLIVSESGTFPSDEYTPDEIAAELPIFLAEVEETLRPDVLIWFSDYITDAFGDGTHWHHMNLTNVDGSLTVVGQAWEAWTQTTIANARSSH